MPRDEYDNYNGSHQKDFVLKSNEFAHILSKTDGTITTLVGPWQTSLSQQQSPVIFNTETKRFDEIANYDEAKQLFISPPEGWYAVLKNPVEGGQRFANGTNAAPKEMNIGKKINICGPASFALFPGQMAKIIQGHRLRSNQYLMTRVYDADAANKNRNTGVVAAAENTENTEVTTKTDNTAYFNGQLMIIKGTDVSFYIPPTGIEVIPVGGKGSDYVRDAVTLERLEYCILKNENGEKRYVHGPAVVFPEPTETFVLATDKSSRFRAIELSKISGIYVKVIAEYEDEDKTKHPLGEELFITGEQQMIYYPRPEHAIIQYDGKFMHHAIAIPAGEGRYIMNRETGEIKTILGPKMYLPDPRFEVVVKRKLTDKQCQLWYPNNALVLEYNRMLNEKVVEKTAKSITDDLKCCVVNYASAFNDAASMDFLESNAGISRGTSYTKPRTITLDNKYDGVVAIDVWTGYAINVVSKTGKREIVVGPQTKLLDYDQTLEYMELSTGKPKTTDHLLPTVYLRVENNKVGDIINAQTKDFVNVQIKVSYCVDFLEEYKDKWFSVENYVKYLCDHIRSLVKREVKNHTIEDFYANSTDIIRNITLNISPAVIKDTENTSKKIGRLFKENGMFIKDVEVLSIAVEENIANILNEHQEEIINKNLELTNAKKNYEVSKQIEEYRMKEAEVRNQTETKNIELNTKLALDKIAKQKEIQDAENAKLAAQRQAESDLQEVITAISDAKLANEKKINEAKLELQKKQADLNKQAQEAYATTVKSIFESIDEDLIAAMTSSANADMLAAISKSMSPYAIAQGEESIVDVTTKLLRGTPMEEFIKNINKKHEE